MNMPAIGQRVEYRHWSINPWNVGTVERYYGGASGTEYVVIKRDGYRETSVLPTDELSADLIRPVIDCRACQRPIPVTSWWAVSCPCGAEYNGAGQRLRSDWRSNRSLYDESISDLDGYELGQDY